MPMDSVERADILIVDDLPEKHLTYRVSLEDLGQNLVTVTSGEAALQLLLEREFAVILLDVNMPGMSGLETAALIRQRKKSRHTPIIFITAFADDVQTAEGYALGAVDYILTPIVPEILRAKVKVFVELFQMRAALTQSHSLLEQRVADRTAELEQSTRAAASRGAGAQAGRGAADDPGAGAGASGEEPAVGVPVHHLAHADRHAHRRGSARDADRAAAVARARARAADRDLLDGRGPEGHRAGRDRRLHRAGARSRARPCR